MWTRPLVELPGVRRLLKLVDRAANDGINVLLVVPSCAVKSGLADLVRQELSRSGHIAVGEQELLQANYSVPAAAAEAADFLTSLQAEGRVDQWQAYLLSLIHI